MSISVDPIRPYLPLIYGVVALAIVGLIGYQHWRIGDLKDARATLERTIEQYAGAQTTNLSTIDSLQRANADLSNACALDARAAENALAAVNAAAAETAAKLAATTKELDHVYRTNPQARTWGRSAVPAAVADRLPK